MLGSYLSIFEEMKNLYRCNSFCLWMLDCQSFVCMVSKILFNIITCFLHEIDTGFQQSKIYSILNDLSKDPKERDDCLFSPFVYIYRRCALALLLVFAEWIKTITTNGDKKSQISICFLSNSYYRTKKPNLWTLFHIDNFTRNF